jgi:hypothetical protein
MRFRIELCLKNFLADAKPSRLGHLSPQSISDFGIPYSGIAIIICIAHCDIVVKKVKVVAVRCR